MNDYLVVDLGEHDELQVSYRVVGGRRLADIRQCKEAQRLF